MAKKGASFFDSIKLIIIEYLGDQVKDHFKTYKKTLFKSIEKNIERKIKREVSRVIKKTLVKIIFFFFLALGMIFLFFGLTSMLVTIVSLPNYFTPLFFGVFLILIALLVYILN